MKGIVLQEGIVNKYGLEAAYIVAVIGQMLVVKKGGQKDFYDNKYWIFENIEWLKENKFKDITISKVKKIIKDLEKNEILEVIRINGIKGMTINYKEFFKQAEEGMKKEE